MRSNDLPFAKKRIIVLHEAGWICALCGGEADEADHIWPRNLGGTDDLSNLQAVCRTCNARKGDRFYLDDLTPVRIDMLLPQLRESVVASVKHLARWSATKAEIVDGVSPAEAYYRLLKQDHPLYGAVPGEFVRDVLAEAWVALLHETPGQAALDALADLEHIALIDASEPPHLLEVTDA